ncbi:S8 family peptidase [Ekhidna sp.]
MAKQPHIKLNTIVQTEGTREMQFNYGFNSDKDDDAEKDYELMVKVFSDSYKRFTRDREVRVEERNPKLDIPTHFDYIEILFQDQFIIDKFLPSWYEDFGLLGVTFTMFNRVGLFVIEDQDKFDILLKDIEGFIDKESGKNPNAEYNPKVKFIKDFNLLTTEQIISYDKLGDLMNFRLVEFPVGHGEISSIYKGLSSYLQSRSIEFKFVESSGLLEVRNISDEIIQEVVKNFDAILSVTSSFSTVVRPSELNVVGRDYGFEISNPDANLPIVGILDTGISRETPLDSILVKDEDFNLTSTSVYLDNANDGYGHGTAVAALAALGRSPYDVGYRGKIETDCRLLSMKILDGNSAYLSSSEVIGLLRQAKQKYPETIIFVLTTCYQIPKATNEEFSSYAYELDLFAHQTDSIVFICTANNNDSANQNDYNLNYFEVEDSNLCTPAESMNNLIVGASAGNLMSDVFNGISPSPEFPALYSRTCYINLEELYPVNKQNRNLFRPDVIYEGGDFEKMGPFIGTGLQASIELLSAKPETGYFRDVGTSFSTPLVANIAAKIQRQYPTLKAQSIKALILNSASTDLIPFDKEMENLRRKTVGNGLVSEIDATLSSDDQITIVIEDSIEPDKMKLIPVNFPSYLTQYNLGKKNGLLKITATLCFSFEPVTNNHLGYCPLHMAFAFFRNQTGDQILMPEATLKSKLKSSWSQNNRFKSKPIPPSNSQKIQFLIGVDDLTDENSRLKLAVHCLLNTQVISTDKYKKEHEFSMAITIEENLKSSKKTGLLYNEVRAINEIVNIAEADLDADQEIELDN